MTARPTHTAEFITEAREHLADVCDHLLRLERASGEALRVTLEQMLRGVHSVKGGAGVVGFRNLENIAHRMESILELAIGGRLPPSSVLVDTLLSAVDRMVALLDDAEHSNEAMIDDLLARLDMLSVEPESGAAVAEAVTGGAPTMNWMPVQVELQIDLSQCEAVGLSTIQVVERVERLGAIVAGTIESGADKLEDWTPNARVLWKCAVETGLSEKECYRQLNLPTVAVDSSTNDTTPPDDDPAPAAVTSIPPPAMDRGGTIRVSVGLADQLMNLAGELVLVRNQSRRFAELNQPLPAPVMQRLDAVTGEFQETVLRTRMQPVGNLFHKFPRLVRDLARQLGKQIELHVSGAEVELDKTILDAVSDPLTHLVRNACDHGIESPELRQQRGKTSEGRIELAARHFGDQIRITIADDGGGIDRAAVRRQAQKQALRTAAELEQLSDVDLFGLILLPGFSTAAQVSEVSGRGVGMDVVKTNLSQLGGSIEIESMSGQGTTFTLRLPLTLAIIPSLLIAAGGQRYAIPQKDLEELVLVDSDQHRARMERTPEQEVVRLRGRLLPLVRLPRLMESFSCQAENPALPRGDDAPVVFAVVKAGGRRYALAVDNVLASEEIVVKPMHGSLRSLTMYSGATILGDGRVALILNTQGIATSAHLRFGEDAEVQPQAARHAAVEMQSVLLVRAARGAPLGVPVFQVRRIVMLRRGQFEQVGGGLFVTIDGLPTQLRSLGGENVVDGGREIAFGLLPRAVDDLLGFVVDEVVGTEMVELDKLHPISDFPGALGATVLRGQITPIIDLARLCQDRSRCDSPLTKHAARVLLVDDTQFFRDLVGGYLRAAGHDVVTAEHGAAALDCLARETFDLIVSDLEMPVMDGWGLATAVRQREEYSCLPMLALTTLSSAEARSAALASGFDAFEVKLDRGTLIASIERLLRQRSGVQPRQGANA